MNIKVVPRTIYLSRHGQSHYNSLKKLGGDSDLTDCGEEYSRSVTLTSNLIVVDKTRFRFVNLLGSLANTSTAQPLTMWWCGPAGSRGL